MEVKELILKELESVSEQRLVEILDFIRFLKAKDMEEGALTLIASESSLKKDWLRPEEDEAWRDL